MKQVTNIWYSQVTEARESELLKWNGSFHILNLACSLTTLIALSSNLSSFPLHCAIHRCMQLISKLFPHFSTSYYLSNIISLQNERTLTRLSKFSEAHSRLETASRINSGISNTTFGGLKSHWSLLGWGSLYFLMSQFSTLHCSSLHQCLTPEKEFLMGSFKLVKFHLKYIFLKVKIERQTENIYPLGSIQMPVIAGIWLSQSQELGI